MNIPLKIIAIYKKGNTPVVKYQEMANSTCARQIFKLFFEINHTHNLHTFAIEMRVNT